MNSLELYLFPRSNARSCGNSTGPAATHLVIYGQHNFRIRTRRNFDHERNRKDTLSFFRSLSHTIFSASNTTVAENFTTISSWTHLARTHAPHLDDLLHTPPEILTRFTDTAPRHHRSHQRSSTSTTLLTASPHRLLRVAPPNDYRPPRGAITGRLPGASVALNF